MPRASRHFLPGYIWHLTHRCHEKSFLLKYKADRQRWLYWLFEAKKRYGLCVLNYMVTSNHVHLLVRDTDVGVIPRSMQLVAGRVAQEYNVRKDRRGAFWQDRYHATAVEDNHHFVQAMIYIDLNMVRAGVIPHPREWPFCGYYETMRQRKRYSIIDRRELMRVLGINSEPLLMEMRRNWVETALGEGPPCRDEKWTDSLAVGGQAFLESIKQKLGSRARGRRVQFDDGVGGGVIKESCSFYSRFSSLERGL